MALCFRPRAGATSISSDGKGDSADKIVTCYRVMSAGVQEGCFDAPRTLFDSDDRRGVMNLLG